MFHRFVVSGLSLCALAGLASATPPADRYPLCWMWSTPDTGTWTTPDFRFLPMARVNEGNNTNPQDTAADLALKVKQLTDDGLIPATGTHICVNIQNFGNPANSQLTDTFYVNDDSVDVNTNDDIGNNADWTGGSAGRNPNFQPWMDTGRANSKQWMDDCIAKYVFLAGTPTYSG